MSMIRASKPYWWVPRERLLNRIDGRIDGFGAWTAVAERRLRKIGARGMFSQPAIAWTQGKPASEVSASEQGLEGNKNYVESRHALMALVRWMGANGFRSVGHAENAAGTSSVGL